MKRQPFTGPKTLCYDVSHWTPVSVHSHMKAAGAKICQIKATESDHIRDDKFKVHVAEAKRLGMIVGFYHFNRANHDPQKQAALYESTVGAIGANDLGPILDLETFDGMDMAHVRSEAGAVIRELHSHFNRSVGLYGGVDKLSHILLDPEVAKLCWLWIAHYGPHPEVGPLIPPPFAKAAFWQFTDGGSQHIDQSWFDGTVDDLKKIG